MTDNGESAGKGADMSENDINENNDDTPNQAGGRTFTEEDVSRIVKERLLRERSKYAGYDELKAKAEKYDAAEEANKSELEKAQESARQAQEQLDAIKTQQEADALKAKVSKETGIPAELIVGNDEDTMRDYAKKLSEFAKVPSAPQTNSAGKFARDASPDDGKRQLAKQIWGND